MSHTWTAAFVMIMANILPSLGVEIRSEELTTTIQTLIEIGGALYIIYRGWRDKHFTLGGRRLN